MDYSVKKYRKRRKRRLDDRYGELVDEVAEYKKRRAERIEDRKIRKDEEPDAWITVRGNHIPIDEENKPIGGQKKVFGSKQGSNGSNKASNRYEQYERKIGSPPKAPKVTGMDDAVVRKKLAICHKIGSKAYDRAKEVAQKKSFLTTFTTHGMEHVQQVLEKTSQAADVIEKLNTPTFKGVPIDRGLMLVSAYMHDTGMDGGDADWSNDNGDGIRANHALNSALFILENAEAIENSYGVNPSQVAFIAFAHTKSKSKVLDLSNPEDWKTGLSIVKNAVDKYNETHEQKLDFDADSIFGGEPNKDNIWQMAGQVASLRLGDANREANVPLTSQTGGLYEVKKYPDIKDCKNLDAERALAQITITDDRGKKIHDLDDDDDPIWHGLGRDSRGISKTTVMGERNMIGITPAFSDKHGTLQEEVGLEDGNRVPWSTAEALKERCGELNTIGSGACAVVVKMTGVNSWDDLHPNAQQAYKDMWADMSSEKKKSKYGNIKNVVLVFDDGSRIASVHDFKPTKNVNRGSRK